MARILDDLHLLELRHWTMSDAERAELRRIEAEDQADREARLDDDWTRRR
jgi:hypothetical protein